MKPTARITPKGQQTRETIVQTAARLVHLQGVAATSLKDVLAASSTGKSQLYHYFRDKDDMVHQVLAYRAAAFERQLGPMLENLSSWEDVERWFAFALEDQRSQNFVGGCPFGTMAAEVADRDENLRLELEQFFRRWIEHIEHGLSNLRKQGLLQPDTNLQQLAAAILASLEGGMLLAKTLKSQEPLVAALNGSFRLLKSYAQ